MKTASIPLREYLTHYFYSIKTVLCYKKNDLLPTVLEKEGYISYNISNTCTYWLPEDQTKLHMTLLTCKHIVTIKQVQEVSILLLNTDLAVAPLSLALPGILVL